MYLQEHSERAAATSVVHHAQVAPMRERRAPTTRVQVAESPSQQQPRPGPPLAAHTEGNRPAVAPAAHATTTLNTMPSMAKLCAACPTPRRASCGNGLAKEGGKLGGRRVTISSSASCATRTGMSAHAHLSGRHVRQLLRTSTACRSSLMVRSTGRRARNQSQARTTSSTST